MENATSSSVLRRPVFSKDRQREPTRDAPATLRLARTIDASEFASIARFGRDAQSRIDTLVDDVMSRLEAGRGIRERVRRDTREMSRLEPKLPSIDGRISQAGVLGYLLDVEDRLSNQYDRVQVRLDGLVPRLNDGSVRLVAEIGLVEALQRRIDDRADELSAFIAAAGFLRDEIAEDDRPPAIDGSPHRGGPLAALSGARRSEQVDRLETRIGNLRASHALALRLAERLRVTRHDLERLHEHLQTGLFDVLPRWNERLQDAIVELRRRQTADVGQRIESTLERTARDESTDNTGGLHFVGSPDGSRNDGTVRNRLASRWLARVTRRFRSAAGLPSSIGPDGLWWS